MKTIDTLDPAPFKKLCMSIGELPTAYLESMTYYEMVAWLCEYVKNNVVTTLNNHAAAIKEIQDWILDLDLQDEVDNKIDEMAESGELAEIITGYLQMYGILAYNSVSALKSAENLINGSFVETFGYYSAGDLGGAQYKVRTKTSSDTPDDATIIQLRTSTLVAELVLPKTIRPEIFGAKSDGTTDDTTAFNKMFAYIKSLPDTSDWEEFYPAVCEGNYVINTVNIPSDLETIILKGNQKGTFRTGGFVIPNDSGWHTMFDGLNFVSCGNPIKFAYRNIEFGKIFVTKCTFRQCTGVCLDIRRRSGYVTVSDCTFNSNSKTAYFEDVDMCFFEKNFVETSSTTVWADNHYDIEQNTPYEGTIFVRNNLFVPAIAQTGGNCAWIKVGRNANIEGNRFSGENEGIHPVYISYDEFDTFTLTKYVYPIVNFINNPIVASKGSILINQACGELNIHNNSFVYAKPIIELTTAGETSMSSLDYDKFYISIQDNAGRGLNFRNHNWHSLSYGRPLVPKSLQKFIKTSSLFAVNTNSNIEAERTDKTLAIKYNSKDLSWNKSYQFLINGIASYNPQGDATYFVNFAAIVSLKRQNVSGVGVCVVPVVKILTDRTDGEVILTAKINGQDRIQTTAWELSDNITLSVIYSNDNDSTATVEFKGFMPIELIPVQQPNASSGNDWAVNN